MNTIFKRAILIAALVAASPAAMAMPLLRGEVTVSQPGTTGVLSLQDIQQAAQAAGITEFEASGLATIRVARAGVVVDMPIISDLIASDLKTRGILNEAMSMQLALDTPLPMLTASDIGVPAQLVLLRYMPGSSTFSARLQISGLAAPVDISGQIQLMIEAPHLSRTLPAGSILRAEDVEMRMVPLNYAETAGLVSLGDIVGKQLQRQTREGVLIRPSDIAAPELISRNDNVTVIYHQGSLTLTTRGKALNAASMNQPVSVLNELTNKVLQGVATRSGTVTIGSAEQQLAKL
jgi:flagellar basal body P-ring formation protein FlgA